MPWLEVWANGMKARVSSSFSGVFQTYSDKITGFQSKETVHEKDVYEL